MELNAAKRNQHKYQPLRAIVGEIPTETGDAKRDMQNLREYVKQTVVAVEYILEHLTLQQFADGELEKIGGK